MASSPASSGGMPPVTQLRGRPLGRILIKMGKVTRAQVSEALEVQKQLRGPIGQILSEMGYVKEKDVNAALASGNRRRHFSSGPHACRRGRIWP